jgi:hypothetical protein
MTAEIITFPHVPAAQTAQALDYYMRADTRLAEANRYELIGMMMATQRGVARPPMPVTEQAVQRWPLLPEA